MAFADAYKWPVGWVGCRCRQAQNFIAALGSEGTYDEIANELLDPSGAEGLGTLGEHGPWRRSVRSSLEVRARRGKDQPREGPGDSDADNEPNGTPIRRGYEGTDSGLAPQGTTLNRPLIHPTLLVSPKISDHT